MITAITITILVISILMLALSYRALAGRVALMEDLHRRCTHSHDDGVIPNHVHHLYADGRNTGGVADRR